MYLNQNTTFRMNPFEWGSSVYSSQKKEDISHDEELWDLEQFCAWLKISRNNVYHFIAAGTLNGACYRKVGKHLRFIPSVCRQLFFDDRLILKRKYYGVQD